MPVWTDIIIFIRNIILSVSFCLSLAGCSNVVRYVPIEIRRIRCDTVTRKDTVKQYVYKERKVTKMIKDSIHTVEDENGNEKSSHRVTERYIQIENRDSIDYYRHLLDSLISIRADSVEVPYPVERTLTRWEQFKIDIGGMAMGAFILLILYLLFLIFKK